MNHVATLSALLLSLAGFAVAGEHAPAVDHHTLGDVTYTDQNGDGIADREVIARKAGSALVKEDRDFDGHYDAQFVRLPDGTRRDSEKVHEKAPRMADLRAGSAVPVGWYIYGFPAWKVIGAAGAVVLVPLAVLVLLVRLWRRMRRRRADAA